MKSIVPICLLFGLLPLFSGFTLSPATAAVEQGPLITATAIPITNCKTGNTCGTWASNLKRYHGVKITLTGASISYYNSNMVYTIYKGTTQIATFPCTQSVVEFASTQLLNNTTYSVTIKFANASSSGAVTFTTGTGAGTSCVTDRH